jgi:hypothetical protein
VVFRIDRRKPSSKVSSKGGKGGKGVARVSRGAGEGKVDRFEKLGRLIGGSAPSDIISAAGPGERATMPLTSWERHDIDTDPLILEAASRMQAYRNLPEPWKKKVDEWGRKVSKEMKYSIAKAIMKKA